MAWKKLCVAVIVALMAVALVSAQERTYTVQPGDSITSIANRFNVSVDAILVRNGIISPDYIRSGQQLIIPTGAVTLPNTYTVQPNDNLTSIATRFNTTVEALRQANNLVAGVPLTVGQELRLPATGGALPFARTYTLTTGDTLRNVGERFGTTWQALAAFNNIANPNYVQAGTVINIPPAGYVPPVAPVRPVQPVQPIPPVQPVQPVQTTYVVRSGDTLSQIAQGFGVSLQEINRVNNITDVRAIQPGQVLVIPARFGTGGPVVTPTTPIAGNVYFVQPGDTMFSIAARSGRNVYAIAQANGILNLNQIFVGQRLFLP
jgi:LysM repeat protein